MGYVACLGQIPEETAHVLQNIVSANGLRQFNSFTGSSPMLTGLERQSPEIPHNFKHIRGGAYENGKF